MSQCYIGTSGYIQQKGFYPTDVKGKNKFKYYATQFNSVEINSSFYRTPADRSIKEWQKNAPEDFIFTFKVLRYKLQYNDVEEANFPGWFEQFNGFENKGHNMLFQYPASKQCEINYLVELLNNLPETFNYAFEFRHPSWFTDDVYTVLKKKNAALVLNDSPRSLTGGRTWPMVDEDNADFTFIRFHGSLAMYASGYLKSELESYAQLIKKKMKSGKNVFCYFNNDMLGFAVKNAKELMELVQ